MTCEKCNLEQRVAALEKDIERNSEQHKEFYARFGSLENFQARTDEKYSNIMREIEKMSETLESLKSAPAKNWNAVVSAAISSIVGVVIGFLLSGGL
jgi:chromosome segregation ATPase